MSKKHRNFESTSSHRRGQAIKRTIAELIWRHGYATYTSLKIAVLVYFHGRTHLEERLQSGSFKSSFSRTINNLVKGDFLIEKLEDSAGDKRRDAKIYCLTAAGARWAAKNGVADFFGAKPTVRQCKNSPSYRSWVHDSVVMQLILRKLNKDVVHITDHEFRRHFEIHQNTKLPDLLGSLDQKQWKAFEVEHSSKTGGNMRACASFIANVLTEPQNYRGMYVTSVDVIAIRHEGVNHGIQIANAVGKFLDDEKLLQLWEVEVNQHGEALFPSQRRPLAISARPRWMSVDIDEELLKARAAHALRCSQDPAYDSNDGFIGGRNDWSAWKYYRTNAAGYACIGYGSEDGFVVQLVCEGIWVSVDLWSGYEDAGGVLTPKKIVELKKAIVQLCHYGPLDPEQCKAISEQEFRERYLHRYGRYTLMRFPRVRGLMRRLQIS